MKLSQIGEFGLIELIKKLESKRDDTIIGIGDDCAVLKFTPQKYLLMTTDALVENVHFRRKGLSFFNLGRKALLTNISDISAMGGYPTHAVVTVGFPKNFEVKSALNIVKGINSVARKYNIDVVGGDTVTSPKEMFISITMLGEVEKENLLTRSGAEAGDLICVTGKFGGPASQKFKIRNSRFKIRFLESRIIARSKLASSMIDSSDGLVRSVLELCKASKVGAEIKTEKAPKAKEASIDQSLYGGEEYELVFTVPPGRLSKLQKVLKNKVSIVGEIVSKSKGVYLIDKSGRRVKPKGGYEHFR